MQPQSTAQRWSAAWVADRAGPGLLWPQSQLAALVAAADPAERAAGARWLQSELVALHRTRDRPLLPSAAWTVAQAGVGWPAEWVEAELRRVAVLVDRQPSGVDQLLVLLRAALGALSEAERAPLAGWLRWYADRADRVQSQPRATELRRWFERLQPATPGSPDPYHCFTDGCPLAGRLRRALAADLARPGVRALLAHCEAGPWQPRDSTDWLAALADRLRAEPRGAAVLRIVAETALGHRPSTVPVYRSGRRVRRRVWAEPATLVLLWDTMLALAAVDAPWVEPLLDRAARLEILAHPARVGRRLPLLRSAHDALTRRRTPAADAALDRIAADSRLRAALPAACYCRDPARCPHRR